MNIIATQQNTRQTSRKVRLVANAVKDMTLEEAVKQLSVMQRKASLVVLKVIRQAIANAEHNHNLSIDKLSIKSIEVTQGPQYRRFRSVSRGRAHSVTKRTSHIVVTLTSDPKPEKANSKKSSEKVSKSEVSKSEKENVKETKPKKVVTKKAATKKVSAKSTKSSKLVKQS